MLLIGRMCVCGRTDGYHYSVVLSRHSLKAYDIPRGVYFVSFRIFFYCAQIFNIYMYTHVLKLRSVLF